MRKVVASLIAIFLVMPLLFLSSPETVGASSSTPLTPHDVNVLVVSPRNVYFKGGHYLVSDLARYGFNVTQHTSDSGDISDYLTDPKTANLDQYDAVILHGGYFGQPPTSVSLEEIRHFTNYAGVLLVIGNALFVNQSNGNLWNDFFFSEPLLSIETRLGIVVVDHLRTLGATHFHNNGTFARVSDLIPGLPDHFDYVRGSYPFSQYQMIVEPTNEAEVIHQFTTQNGVSTSGVTFYRNATGAVGIYIQGSYIYAELPITNQIKYFGIADTSRRSALLASLIAYALGKDVNTVIKPQPLANVRLDGLGSDARWDEPYLNASLGNFDAVVDAFNIGPTVGFTDIPQSWNETTLLALTARDLYLLDLKKNTGDWWNLRVVQNVILHEGAPVGVSVLYENFTQINADVSRAKDALHAEYFSSRDQWALAVLNGFPGYIYNVRNFRRNEVGTYSLQTIVRNLSSEIPDIRFVPLIEAGLYFGNKWVRINNAWRDGSMIEFDVDASAIPRVADI